MDLKKDIGSTTCRGAFCLRFSKRFWNAQIYLAVKREYKVECHRYERTISATLPLLHLCAAWHRMSPLQKGLKGGAAALGKCTAVRHSLSGHL